jgi:hypothetical protein
MIGVNCLILHSYEYNLSEEAVKNKKKFLRNRSVIKRDDRLL